MSQKLLNHRGKIRLGGYLAALTALLIFTGCDKELDGSIIGIVDSPSNVSESAAATVGSIANDTESDPLTSSAIDPALDGTANLAQAACTYTNARSTCTGAVSAINWNGCTLTVGNGYSVSFTGGWTNTYDSSATCSTAQSGSVPTGHSVTRTMNSFVVRIPGGSTVTNDTSAHQNYLGATLPGTGITTTVSGGTRTIVIDGMHRVLKSATGTPWFDHSLKSSGLTVSGARSSQNRIVNGTTTLYHNLAKFTATSTLNSVTWGSSTCCYPTSGSVSTTFTGSVTGTTTMTYGACGSATFVDTTGASSSVSLKLCE
jgi:hypothetical protein